MPVSSVIVIGCEYQSTLTLSHSLCNPSICIFLLPKSKHNFIDQKKDILHKTELALVFLHHLGLTIHCSLFQQTLIECLLSFSYCTRYNSEQTRSILRKGRHHLELKNKQTKNVIWEMIWRQVSKLSSSNGENKQANRRQK